MSERQGLTVTDGFKLGLGFFLAQLFLVLCAVATIMGLGLGAAILAVVE